MGKVKTAGKWRRSQKLKGKRQKSEKGREMTQCAVAIVAAWVAALAGWEAPQGRPHQGAPRTRIVLVGDSTVTDESGWGLGFRRLVAGQAEVVNEAASGRSSKSYLAEGRWTR